MDSLNSGIRVDNKNKRVGKTLNPNAAEFVPFVPRSTCVNSIPDVETKSNCNSGLTIIHPLEYSISNISDEHEQECIHHQLPGDIIPDFRVFEKEEDQQHGISLSPLSLLDDMEEQLLSTSLGSKSTPYLLEQLPRNIHIDEFGHPSESHNGLNHDQDLNMHELVIDNNSPDPLEFLGSQFPDFAAQGLADVYYANGYDLNLTIEMLTRLELQFEGNCNQISNPKVPSAPNLTSVDFPALPISHSQPGQLQNSPDVSKTGSLGLFDSNNTPLFKNNVANSLKSAVDFASVAKKATQGFGARECDRIGTIKQDIKNRQTPLTMMNNCRKANEGRSVFREKPNPRSINEAPTWLETGDAVASLYSELRAEAQDHARVRNAYFEQATKAYLVGNKALAKELSFKGQMHNLKMKLAHEKAQKSIYNQRNPAKGVVSENKERLIDLHGLHVSEAIHVLKQELPLVVKAARLADQRFEVYVCVGTGHHTKGSRTPARLPVAVQNYLIGEGFEYTEPHPGLLLLSL